MAARRKNVDKSVDKLSMDVYNIHKTTKAERFIIVENRLLRCR